MGVKGIRKAICAVSVDYDNNANWRGHHQDVFGIVELVLHVHDCGQMLYQSLFIAAGLLQQANMHKVQAEDNGER